MASFFKLSQSEKEITSSSFTRFSLRVFQLASFNLGPLQENASLRQKIVYLAKNAYVKVFLLCYIIAILSFFTSVLKAKTWIDASPAMLDCFAYLLCASKIFNTFYRKNEIWLSENPINIRPSSESKQMS